ncbi:hypothetical protein BD408DRAFT_424383 [Parasitella parasitica]|nr:hypothetical protein BD408DRAFT_424383 [Parasitella parasitica]
MAIAKYNTMFKLLFYITSFGCQCQDLFYIIYLGTLQYLNIYDNMRGLLFIFALDSRSYEAKPCFFFRVFYMML